MKEYLDHLFSDEDIDIERVADKYKAAGDKEKERIFEATKRKYDKLRTEYDNSSDDGFIKEAEGVEMYRRPGWIRFVCGAAAAVVLLGGAFGGILLSRSQKVQHMSHSSVVEEQSTVPTAVNEKDNDKKSAVKTLVSNYEQIMRTQYPVGEDLSDHIWFNVDAYAPEVDQVLNLTKYYYAVSDPELDSFEEIDAKLRETFSDELYDSYLGGDLTDYEVGYDFKDDSLANKYIRNFIQYNGKTYALSLCEPNASYSAGFEQLYNFSEYKLISSDFKEGGRLLERNMVYFSEESGSEELEGLTTCTRVYERADGGKVTAEIQMILKEGSWRIAAFDVNGDPVVNTVPEPTTVPVEEPNNEEEFAELQLHDLKVYDSLSEASAAMKEINERYRAERPDFKKVDVEKYTQQILGATTSEEYNTLENKSYVYHMMLNSKFYFDTAKGSALRTDGNIEFAVDYKNRYAYEHFTKDINSESGPYNSFISYSDEKDDYLVYPDEKEYSYNEMTDEDMGWYDGYIPDNERTICYYNENGEIVIAGDTLENLWSRKGFESLYPGIDLFDFSAWSISGTEKRLGRDCVDVTMQVGNYTTSLVIDLRTGILISTETTHSGDLLSFIEITDLTIDENVEKIPVDITGFADMNSPERQEY